MLQIILRYSLLKFEQTDVIRAFSEAIDIVQKGKHDPIRAHERVKTFYNWDEVTSRTEKVYDAVLRSRQLELWERIERSVISPTEYSLILIGPKTSLFRTMDLGPFAGPIYTIILLVDCLFFLFLEWWIPRESLHYVHHHWDKDVFEQVGHFKPTCQCR